MQKLLLLLLLTCFACGNSAEEENSYISQIEAVSERLEGTGYNREYCILVDFSLHSGKNRMFLYNLKTNEIEKSLLVAHGDGCGQQNGTPTKFSNTVNSNCSSEGFAVLGNRDYSNYGINIKYWLEGLEATNNRIKERVVVIHSWDWIPNVEIYPLPIAQSQGCFTVSNSSLRFLDDFISEQQNKKLLLYAFK